MTKNIAILGSTGSIGLQTLQVIAALGAGYRVVALTARSNSKLLAEQVRQFNPEMAALSDERAAAELSLQVSGSCCPVKAGAAGQLSAARWPSAEMVVVALVGFSGFEPVIAALQEGKSVALANKESLVVGGELLNRMGLLAGERIIPVDSEHSAIWQCIGSTPVGQVDRIWLTASGGPFNSWDQEKIFAATPEEALDHPKWRMGQKISIDSATMMNKGFEVLEAHWLFGVPLDRIKVVVHPQSIVHSMVEFVDGSIIAQIGLPDMRLPIQYALTYPERKPAPLPRLGIAGQSWSFEEPDRSRFPSLELAYRAGQEGGTMPACLNAANEVAVDLFLDRKISFGEIPQLIETVMNEHELIAEPDVEDIINSDHWARRRASIAGGKNMEGSTG